MTDDDAFLTHVRDELHRTRSLSAATCAGFESLTAPTRAAYAHAIAFAGCQGVEASLGIDIEIAADDRIHATELMLLKLAVDTGAPVWSSHVLEQMERDVLRVRGGEVDDLLRGLAAVLQQHRVPLTDTLANFIKDVVVLAWTQHRDSFDRRDGTWLVGDVRARPTAALAYLALLALPDEQLSAVEEAILGALANSPFAEEANRLLAEDGE
jgi:hypothetical protein